MLTYKPTRPPEPPKSVQDMVRWAQEMHRWTIADSQAVERAANAGSDSMPLRYLTSAPSRPKDGAIYLADGTNFNPGSGKGAYRYDASSATYTFLG